MAQWKKIIVSGSAAELESVYATGPITGSIAKFANLATGASNGTSKIVAIAEGDGSLKKRAIDVRVFDGGLLGSFGGAAGQVSVYLDSENIYGDNQFTWNPTTNVLTVSGSTIGRDVSIVNDLTVGGNLTINGTTTVIDTTNLAVEDKFVAIATGTTSGTDGGIIVVSGSVAGNTVGYALAFDAGAGRWALRKNANITTTGIIPDAFMVTSTWGSGAPSTVPLYGGVNAGLGNMHIDTATGDIYIFVETGAGPGNGGTAGDVVIAGG